MARITIHIGSTVHTVAFSAESFHTSGLNWAQACQGRSTQNWATHSAQATPEAKPIRRKEPKRATVSPPSTR
jgi:hypothetical protein